MAEGIAGAKRKLTGFSGDLRTGYRENYAQKAIENFGHNVYYLTAAIFSYNFQRKAACRNNLFYLFCARVEELFCTLLLSLPPRGAWIEMVICSISGVSAVVAPPRGERGLKSCAAIGQHAADPSPLPHGASPPGKGAKKALTNGPGKGIILQTIKGSKGRAALRRCAAWLRHHGVCPGSCFGLRLLSQRRLWWRSFFMPLPQRTTEGEGVCAPGVPPGPGRGTAQGIAERRMKV